jgi:hypothetical protein
MKKEKTKLNILTILNQDVNEIFSSRVKSKVIHNTNNIDASGDEVEQSVRRIIKRKIPTKYYVSHGHIVDENLTTSKQLDIIIADNSGSPVLFTAENGTEYFPFESIYAFGEIKSTYYKSRNYIENFIAATKEIIEDLKRNETPDNQLTQDLKINFNDGINFNRHSKIPYQNPLFKFMIFVDSKEFNPLSIIELFSQTEDKFLPNFICFLDKGTVVKAKVIKSEPDNHLGEINLFPEFISSTNKKEFEWVFLEFDEPENRAAVNLAFLNFAIDTHLKNSLLLKPNLMKYFDGMFKSKGIVLK